MKKILTLLLAFVFIFLASGVIASASAGYSPRGYYISVNINNGDSSSHTVSRPGDNACCPGQGHVLYFHYGTLKSSAVYGRTSGSWHATFYTPNSSPQNFICQATTSADGTTIMDRYSR